MSRLNNFSQSPLRLVVPLIGALIALLLGTMLIYPMLKMEPRDIPIAIISLDEGVTVDEIYINSGDEMIRSITDSNPDEVGESLAASSDMIVWTVFESQQELDRAMENGEYYASLTIPADFSKSQLTSLGRQMIGAALTENLSELTEGAVSISDGSASLHEGTIALANGLEKMDSGVKALETQVVNLPSQTQSLAEGSSHLVSGLTSLEQGAFSLSGGIVNAKTGVDGADGAIDAAMAALNSPTPDVATAMQYLAGAKQATTATSQGLEALEEGAQTLYAGLSSSRAGADNLNGYLVTLADNAPSLSEGVSSLSSGTTQLSSGANSLKDGTKTLSEGTGTFAGTFISVSDVLGKLPLMEDEAFTSSTNANSDSLQVFDTEEMNIESLSLGSNISPIALLINQGKNPMISSSLQSALSTMSSSSGLGFDTEYLNPLPEEMSMGFTHMILMILTYVSSYATAAMIANIFKLKKNSRSSLLRSLSIQIIYAISLSLVVGICIASILTITVSDSISFVDIAIFVAIASLSFQLVVIAALNWFGMAGMVVPIGLLVLGMGAAYLPTEFLPAFWQQFVYPWDPLRFMVDGFKGILYMGQSFWNDSTIMLIAVMLIGFVFFVTNFFRPINQSSPHRENHPFLNK